MIITIIIICHTYISHITNMSLCAVMKKRKEMNITDSNTLSKVKNGNCFFLKRNFLKM